ncbi:hypothetical protein EB796_019504 [Bugula neritina]|uniref:Uncharacterized protein n=1 Tax=Bugula neritina TaxID=10212 RepID=A0A7J7J8A4_BUGNE|nr:hypothetical protein EB796_019504 [Bugula neritina]
MVKPSTSKRERASISDEKVSKNIQCGFCLSTHHNVLSLKELVNFLRKPINKLSKRLMDKEGALLKLFKVTSDIISEYEIETQSFVAKLHESRDCQLAALKDGYSSVEADFVKARGEVLNQMKEFMEVRVEKNLSEIDHHQRRIDTRFKHSHMVDIIRGHRDSKDELGLLLDNKLAEVPKLELKNLALASKKKCRNLEIEIVPTRALVIDFLSGSATQEPQSLKLCKQVSTNQCTISVCFYAGNTYISFDDGSIAVLDSDYDIMPLHYDYMGVLDHVEGIAILNDVMYSLVTLGDESVYIYVHDLTGNYVNHWKHPDLAYSYNKITVVGNKLVVPDRQHGQLMVYSLYGEVLDQIACGLNTCMAVACANSELVVVSDSEASTVFIINIVTGETLWSCQTVGKPQGVVCYRNSCVLVYSRSSEMLCVLDIGTGKLLSEISNDGLKGSIYDLDIDGDMLIVPKCYAEQVLFYQLL